MRDPRYAIGLEFLDLYKKEIGASEPQDDFDDRNALYSMYASKMVSPNLGLSVSGATTSLPQECGRNGHRCFTGKSPPLKAEHVLLT